MSLKDRLSSNNIKKNEELIINTKPVSFQLKKESAAAGNNNIPNGINILDALLVDENINSVYVNGAKNVFIERKGDFLKSTVSFRDNIQLTNLILKLAEEAGIEENKISSFMKFTYKPGINIKVTFPPISNVPSLFIKCYHDKLANIQNFQETGIISKELSCIFEALSLIKYNVVIAGENNTLKTSVISSISKLIPANFRGAIFDNMNELKPSSSCVSYNLSTLKEKEQIEIVNSVINSKPDKIILNDTNEELFPLFSFAITKGYQGIVTSINSSSKEEALEKITKIILTNNPELSYEEAKKITYNNFNLIIFCEKDENGKRKISSISEIENNDNDFIIKDIFKLTKLENNEEEFSSTGIIPRLYEFAKSVNLPINANIFINDYKHTYSKVLKSEIAKKLLKGQNVINKFKKGYIKHHNTVNIPESDVIEKAREKFEALKKNAKQQNNINLILSNTPSDNNATIQEINSFLNTPVENIEPKENSENEEQ